MEERVKISILLDIYEKLLTEKQKSIMDLYYNDDLSLSEISELTNTSRQAVYDIIKRCNKLLIGYENKIGLMDKTLRLMNTKKFLLSEIDKIKCLDEESQAILKNIKQSIIDNF
ncbi:putative DNA-binding protein [Clostridium sp. JN-1]|uniref:putative DNA-binding protein n=1 Tax=Clostridium sp. JN-1 TaxID=2483110 RepID=UPI000F0B7994|nr:putative DNA-binding protein [Clostridium sp. JN-1]